MAGSPHRLAPVHPIHSGLRAAGNGPASTEGTSTLGKAKGRGGSPLSIIQRECWRWIAGEAPGGGRREPWVLWSRPLSAALGPLRGARTLWKLNRGDPWTLNGGPHSGHRERKQPSMDPCSSFCVRHLLGCCWAGGPQKEGAWKSSQVVAALDPSMEEQPKLPRGFAPFRSACCLSSVPGTKHLSTTPRALGCY
jgi:hypothetical protein